MHISRNVICFHLTAICIHPRILDGTAEFVRILHVYLLACIGLTSQKMQWKRQMHEKSNMMLHFDSPEQYIKVRLIMLYVSKITMMLHYQTDAHCCDDHPTLDVQNRFPYLSFHPVVGLCLLLPNNRCFFSITSILTLLILW